MDISIYVTLLAPRLLPFLPSYPLQPSHHEIFCQKITYIENDGNTSVTTVNAGLGADNPLFGFVSHLVSLLVAMAALVIVVMIVYTGYLFLTSGSSSDGQEKAKTALKNTVIGAFIIFGAGAISSILQNDIIGPACS